MNLRKKALINMALVINQTNSLHTAWRLFQGLKKSIYRLLISLPINVRGAMGAMRRMEVEQSQPVNLEGNMVNLQGAMSVFFTHPK